MKTEQRPPVLLFYASRQIGGGEAYFINLGLEAIKAGRRCVVVDYAGGYVINRIPGAEHVEYSDDAGADYLNDCEAFIPLGAIVFLGSKLRISLTSKVLFVSIHHNHSIELGNWAWLLRGMRPRTAGRIWPYLEPIRFRSVRNFLEGISHRRGLVYCAPFQRDFDESYLGLPLQAAVVPIPVPRRQFGDPMVVPKGKAIVWVSRLAKEKAEILYEIIRELEASQSRRKLIVIGDGPFKQTISERAVQAGIEIETPGIISGFELDEYLRLHAELCIGVGTAAVEMAMAGFPTLVARLPGYCEGPFIWFFQTSAGDTIVTPKTNKSAVGISAALRQLQGPDDWAHTARISQEAAFTRHAPEASWEQLDEALASNRLTVSEATSLGRMNEQPYRIIRSIKVWLRRMISESRR